MRAIFVITKCDLTNLDRRQVVSDDIRHLTADTVLAGSPIITCSSVTGEGLERLRSAIAEALQVSQQPPPQSYFRLPVDRAFSVAGHGVIVTGTAVSGGVRCNATVRRLPGNDLWRVRRIEVHNESVETAMRGQRIALNLAGSTHDPLKRGDVIVDPAITLTCSRFDARVAVRPAAPSGLKSHQRVRVYLGTSERMGTLIALGRRERPGADDIAPGETAYCQIRVSPPLLAMRGDRFILRDETAQRTIGGGMVILAAAPIHQRTDPALPLTLDILERGERAGAALVSVLTEPRGEFTIALSALAQLLNRRDEDVRSQFDALDGIHVFAGEGGVHYASDQACRDIKSNLLDALRRWHVDHPLFAGLDIEDARSAVAAGVQARIFRLLVAELVEHGAVVREDHLLRLPSHRIVVPEADAPVVAQIITMLGVTPLAPPDLKQIADRLAIDRRKVVELLRALEKGRQIVCIAPEIYFLADWVERIRAELVGELSARGSITTAGFRDRYHTSRKYAIPLLEYFDRTGITTRIGEVRRLKHASTDTR
jgi:selenocysteine-specific elongation factor